MSVMVKYMTYSQLKEASAVDNGYADFLEELIKCFETQKEDEYYILNGDFYVILRRYKKNLYGAYIQVIYENHEEYLLTTSNWYDVATSVTLFVKGMNIMIKRLNGEVK